MVARWWNGPWRVPAIAGALIVASLLASAAGAPSAAADALMIAAAALAAWRIVRSAARALRAGVVGIDLLVSAAAIGAVLIGDFWEAAAVTFLFTVGHALEAQTLARTRSALTELVDLTPTTALLYR
ncbi:MAG: cation-transporting P-type ATPase, partial [Actinobacteria bacterium]|nr:cation-transporting P-type ATPase [Actinomycetota bacterium]